MLGPFQPTPPRGRRRIWTLNEAYAGVFQPTPPRGRRRSQRLKDVSVVLVSTHASAREATCKTSLIATCDPRFNPRLRAGGDETAAARGEVA